MLRAPGPAADACRALVDLALEAGGKDNVTVVLGAVPHSRTRRAARGSAAALSRESRAAELRRS